MSTSPSLRVPPVADPSYPNPDVTPGQDTSQPTVNLNGVFTEDEDNFLQSVLLFWEETSSLARPFESTDPQKDGYDPNLDMLTRVRAKLAALKLS